MSAEVLRRAAELMRVRAEAAPSGPWVCRPATNGDPANGPTLMIVDSDRGAVSEHEYDKWGGASADHIAAWHPAVALAVADWLDHLAENDDHVTRWQHGHALTVARAYLGESA